jgi:para-aminobenzoate synthetase
MKTLLLDNFDSYTYNLFQLIAQVQGTEPIVMRNDAPEGADLDLRAFDNVVISPGPGHPCNSSDFGFSRRIVAESGIPVLGVCLGHQGIGLEESAAVVPAPVPRHGHLTTIRHDGQDLFAGIPQDFTAVRYHSFCLQEPLPPTLEATAWSEDGVLMGVRHRRRPLWGVQFHPESVLTEHGEQLIANFRDLTHRHASAKRQVAAGWTAASTETQQPTEEPPSTEEPRPAEEPPTIEIPVIGRESADPPAGYRLQKRVLDFAVDAEQAFVRRFARGAQSFWLDSSRVAAGQARFSYFGDGTGPLAEFVRYDVQTGVTAIERPGQAPRRVFGSVFDHLKSELTRRRVDDVSLPFDFTCGYVGYLGYEMKGDCGAVNQHQAVTPDACWLFADRMVVVDHQDQATYVLCLAEDTPAGQAGADQWLESTAGFLHTVGPAAPEAAVKPVATASDTSVEPWLVRDREQYLADIAACRRKLIEGESYEICVTDSAWLPAPGDPLGYYRLLRQYNPAPYAAYLQFGDVTVASSSPERFLKISRDGTVEAKPIKGTAPRHPRPEEDRRLRDSLATSAKTRAENLMIVDLLRNDLGQVCEVGSVSVPTLMATESYATVHQLVSTVRGTLRADGDPVDCVRACFPAGSMTGAPKLRTLEIIDSLETEARGVYSGTIGFLSCNGTADLNVVIRTAVFVDGQMHLGAGGAIVLDSDPEEEYAEMLLKMAAQIRTYWAWTWTDVPTRILPQQGSPGREVPRSGPTRTRTLARPGQEIL